MNPSPTLEDRARGAYLGLALGDALGATVEFMTANEIKSTIGIHRNITGGGWLKLPPGAVTDDTQMALALGHAIVRCHGNWNLKTVADAFAAWLLSHPPDVGNTCRRGIRRYLQNGSLSATPAEEDAGNGAAMRNLPVIISNLYDGKSLEEKSLDQAHITHAHPLSDAAVLTVAKMTQALILGQGLERARELARELEGTHPQFSRKAWRGLSTGYIVDTVQTVFDAFFNTRDFESCLTLVVNRGGDADTTGALAGQLAGALYGAGELPHRWLKRLNANVAKEIELQTEKLLYLSRSSRIQISLQTP